MKFLVTLASLALAAIAAPAPGDWGKWNNGCASREYIQYLVDQEIVYLQHLDVAAGRAAGEAIFAADIVEYGDSINSLRQAPVSLLFSAHLDTGSFSLTNPPSQLGTIVETDAASYINDTLSTPPIPQIDLLSLTVECNQFVWQWRFYGIGPGPNPYIQGFTLATVNSAGLINYQYVEFNSLAWAENSGYTVTPPTTGPFAPPSK